MVWGVGIIARPNQTGKPMLVAITN
jgi:hypothetical protein